MSDSDAYEDGMRIFSSIGDRDQDRVLAGRTEAVGDDLRELAAFCHQARALFVIAPSESVAVRHLAEIAAAVRNGVPDAPAPVRRRAPFASLGTRLALAGAGTALLAAFAGGALAGALPGALQGKVAGIARNVGLSLPDGRTHPPPVHSGGRPKTLRAKPVAGDGGAAGPGTETRQRGGAETTQREADRTAQEGADTTTQGEVDTMTHGEVDTMTQGEADKATQGASDSTTQADTQQTAPDGSDPPRQPSGAETASPTSGDSAPETDSLASSGVPTVSGDAPPAGEPAAPVVPAAPTSSGDDGG